MNELCNDKIEIMKWHQTWKDVRKIMKWIEMKWKDAEMQQKIKIWIKNIKNKYTNQIPNSKIKRIGM